MIYGQRISGNALKLNMFPAEHTKVFNLIYIVNFQKRRLWNTAFTKLQTFHEALFGISILTDHSEYNHIPIATSKFPTVSELVKITFLTNGSNIRTLKF